MWTRLRLYFGIFAMAGLCAFCIAWPSALVTHAAGLLIRLLLDPPPDYGLGDRILDTFLFLVSIVLSIYLGIAFGRFLLRAVPPRLSETASKRSALLPIFIVFTLCVGPAFFRSLWAYQKPVEAVPFMLWCVCGLYPVYLRHRGVQSLLNQPFVLFLRRFSTVSDRAIVELVLKHTPIGQPVLFLTPTRSLPSDWNPLLVAFAGLKLLGPVRSIPMVLRASDDKWQTVARELIRRANLIVYDTTERGAAIDAEGWMIVRERQEKHTLCVRNESIGGTGELEQRIVLGGGKLITYEWRWHTAARRLLVGLLAFVMTPFFIAVFTQTSLYISFASPTSIVLTTFSLGLSFITAAQLYRLIFAFPSRL